MNPRTSFFAITFSVGLLALTSSGCSTFRNRHAGPDATHPVGGKSLDLLELRDNVKATRLALDRTTDSLNRIPGSPAPQQAYEAFRTALTDFQKLADKTIKESDTVRERGRELFAEWSAETESINDPQIRTVAEQRRATLQESYNSMLTPLITARSELNKARSDLADIQKALALDLTPAGIDATKESIDRITRGTTTSVESLDTLAARLDKIADALPAATVAEVE
jgi:hypothetical protein